MTAATNQALDEAGFAELYRAHYPELLRYAQSLLGGAPGAQDAVQEAFLRLWRRKHEIDPTRPVRALLYAAVRNLVFNLQRDTRVRRRLLATMSPASAAPDPEALAASTLVGEKIAGWIAELPDRRREAFSLSRFHGLRHEEIAGIMGVAPKTVENHIVLALKYLRDRLNTFDSQLLRP
jgi:RNA polymerase sigma-70 factor (ECF subfamily)